MKVKLAAQVFSNSVATALNFLNNKKFSELQNSEAKSSLIRTIGRIFEFLNSCKVTKSPLSHKIYTTTLLARFVKMQ